MDPESSQIHRTKGNEVKRPEVTKGEIPPGHEERSFGNEKHWKRGPENVWNL